MRKFKIIYADPPWQYNDRKPRRLDGAKPAFGMGASNHYPCMTVKEICDLPVEKIASVDCALYLWVTWPFLEVGIKVIKAWGFKFINCGFNWVKTDKVAGTPCFLTGNYTRGNSEPCLYAIKKELESEVIYTENDVLVPTTQPCLFGRRGKVKRYSHRVPQLIVAPMGKHSEKPAGIRDGIVELCGDLNRIELFARTKTPGWKVWGNEVESDIEL